MLHDNLIGPPPGSTPAELRSRRGARDLPDDLLKEASRRLGIMALVGAALWVFGDVLFHVAAATANPPISSWVALNGTDVIAAASALLSLALFAYTRRTTNNPRFVLDLGLAFLIVTGLALGLIAHWEHIQNGMSIRPAISWTGAVVLMFAAIVPNAPRKVLVAGLIAVSMNPVSMLIARARGTWDFGTTGNVLVMHFPDYLLVGVAVVIAHVVTRLGQQVTKAREMGSYRLGELLGRGGMGEVYRATHRMLARPAAIKLIRPEMLRAANGETAQLAATRFRREAEAAANLRSPHTVELYDFGITEDQTLYFVMELLDGMDLESLVREYGPVPAARVIHILRQVCESLEEAHAYGLVHRDIKPPNIHLGRVGLRYDFVKVLDFGLVKSLGDKPDAHTAETAQGMTPGTPSYMAPEMALGEHIDGRADIYALGCVAYYLLTGEPVFEADNMLQMIVKHMQAEPVLPSLRTSARIPEGLEKLVMACLAKDPANRPQTATTLGRSLATIDTDPWSEEQARNWWAVHRPVVARVSA